MQLIAGSTGFLGNEILRAVGIQDVCTIALGRRSIPNLPDNARELIIDFDELKTITFPNIDHVYLSLGYPLYFQNVMGFMSSTLKENFFQVDFTYQLEIAKKAIKKKTGARGLRSILENILLKTMFELPDKEDVLKVTIDKSSAKGDSDPIITYGKKQSTSVA